ncbi:hypothetical protein L484_020170 [Morus notabilis]|uniref:Uncharacterized protein n=1 Tax=Morus notabilis TaxID=981085 RepID=W9QN48_9ROSA|nr:hypothetical protein L484_020170 [Morus notabilis]
MLRVTFFGLGWDVVGWVCGLFGFMNNPTIHELRQGGLAESCDSCQIRPKSGSYDMNDDKWELGQKNINGHEM